MGTNVMGFSGRLLPSAFGLQVGVQNPTAFAQQVLTNKFGTFPVQLQAASAFIVPEGQFLAILGPYTFFEFFDPISQFWRIVSQGPGIEMVNSDGANYRLCNRTGSVVGAVITNSGSAYAATGTSYGAATLPTVTSANGATYRCIAGGALNSTITKTAAGSGYTYPPLLIIDPPPVGGIQATATTTLSSGAIGTITVTNQGAGYVTAPSVQVVNAPGDTTGTGAVLTTALIATGGTAGAADTICAIVPTNLPTAAQTSVPSFTIVNGAIGTGLAATAIMCVTTTAITTTGMTNAANGSITYMVSSVTAGSATLTNPAISTGLFNIVNGWCANQTAAGACTIIYGGLHQIQPVGETLVTSNGTISAAITYGTNTFGGASDTSWLQAI
jgi:hypothetical protein